MFISFNIFYFRDMKLKLYKWYSHIHELCIYILYYNKYMIEYFPNSFHNSLFISCFIFYLNVGKSYHNYNEHVYITTIVLYIVPLD